MAAGGDKLSQDDIDALLAAIARGEDPTEAEEEPPAAPAVAAPVAASPFNVFIYMLMWVLPPALVSGWANRF